MRTATKIAAVISAAAIAGLATLAIPAVATAGGAASTAASSVVRFFATASPDEVDTSSRSHPADTSGLPEDADPNWPDGYADVGHGTWIPKGDPGDCVGAASIYIGSDVDGGPYIASLALPENLVDMGVNDTARGEVGYGPDGGIATYTVEPGDALFGIGDRFCIENGLMIATLNGHRGSDAIQPGEVLVLNPAEVPDFEFNDPYAE
ncbi:hypothetical protein FHX49_002546 [Microbacterium endophyticum]|uniref:LysM domain-containing protein n=1 Tax=Microbacterium endophyticum TaxID=1526412 RepID=A0A7W4V1M8_9MICO|nr:LysM domain-containing protein [Microbacterium endophyticum]MBB2974463.1 hypothetical protein [Microbacterium endophyticum]MBB2976954.1 hypothetical protein [Microbacterium endophyticum]NIK36760.1 hypothetical protein [Microbacterium endophyticum]